MLPSKTETAKRFRTQLYSTRQISRAKHNIGVRCGKSFWSITGGGQQQKTVFRSAAEMSVHHKSFVCPQPITLCASALIILSNGARRNKRDRNCTSSAIMTPPGPNVKTRNRHVIICSVHVWVVVGLSGVVVGVVCGWCVGGCGGAYLDPSSSPPRCLFDGT